MHILFDDGRLAEYTFTQSDELDLAYCISIHKSQGSEFPTVLLPLAGGPAMLLNRNLLYTAVTRAKGLVYCLGHRDTVARMVRTVQSRRRYTSLAIRLQEV
jgi:exodeoxyribonuclease V alpha subunit